MATNFLFAESTPFHKRKVYLALIGLVSTMLIVGIYLDLGAGMAELIAFIVLALIVILSAALFTMCYSDEQAFNEEFGPNLWKRKEEFETWRQTYTPFVAAKAERLHRKIDQGDHRGRLGRVKRYQRVVRLAKNFNIKVA